MDTGLWEVVLSRRILPQRRALVSGAGDDGLVDTARDAAGQGAFVCVFCVCVCARARVCLCARARARARARACACACACVRARASTRRVSGAHIHVITHIIRRMPHSTRHTPHGMPYAVTMILGHTEVTEECTPPPLPHPP